MRDPLIEAALRARGHAHAPFSKFLVGAALEDTDGQIHTGANVESPSYGLTMCAERVAAFHAVSQGVRGFRRMAVAADTAHLTPPCGACRQVIWDLCGDIEIILVNPAGATETMRLRELIPRAFDATYLD